MRIIAGERRGRPLRGPRKSGVRPTGAYLREAVFNVLAPRLAGVRMLDLFAGTGAVGLEALSRGAAAATFVDQEVGPLRVNLARLGFGDKAVLLRGDALRAVGRLAGAAHRFDLIYADPPYGTALASRTVAAVAAGGLLAPGGVLLVEHHHKLALPQTVGALARLRELRHGETVVTFYGEAPA